MKLSSCLTKIRFLNGFQGIRLATLILLLGVNTVFSFATAGVAANGSLAGLKATGLSPAFAPNITQYTVPAAVNCSVAVTAVLPVPDNPNIKLYISSTPVASGTTVNAWVCDGKKTVDIVIYNVWTEVGRYTITPIAATSAPPPPPVSGKLTELYVTGLTPAFNPEVKQYTAPAPVNCSMPVMATVANPGNPNLKLYIASTPTSSGKTVNTWVCNGKTKAEIIIFDVWNEVGRYTVTSTGTPATSPVSTPVQPPSPPPTPVSEANPIPEPAPAVPELPSVSATDYLTATRFLEQASFGPTANDIAAVQAVGLPYWMAKQANIPASAVADGIENNQLVNQQFLNMYKGQDQLRQRMIFALSQTLVVSTNKNINGEELIPWVRLLSKHAFGNYRSLLREVTLSPTMGKYLDLANSKKSTGTTSPNENFARELMQLFTIGLVQLNQDGSIKRDAAGQAMPTYNQQTLREFARALTGWTYPTKPGATVNVQNWEYFVGLMEPRPQYHDMGNKTLLNGKIIPANQTVTKDMDAVLENLFQHPNVPPFIATRLIRSLVTSNPSPEYIKRVADVFVDNGKGVRGDLWAVLTAVLTDTEATGAPTVAQGHLKDPVIHIMSLGRALNAQITDPNVYQYLFAGMGQKVLSPATVFSFYSPLSRLPGQSGLFAPEFQIYSSGLAIQRANFIYNCLNSQMGAGFIVDLTPFIAVANTPDILVEKVNTVLFQGRMSPELKAILLELAVKTPDAKNRVSGALYFAAISSEYAVQR